MVAKKQTKEKRFPERKKFSKERLAIILLSTILIFSAGYILGNKLGSLQLFNLNSAQDDLNLQLSSIELQNLLLAENPCNMQAIREISSDLDKLASKIQAVELSNRVSNKRILQIKEPYFILEIKHYLLFRQFKEKCDIQNSSSFILYFYSNEPGKCDKCSDQGYILTFLQQKYGYDSLKVYSFDSDSQNSAIKTLKSIYNITSVPSLVINGKAYNRFMTKNELDTILSWH
ncbi:hypothetical protein HZA33_00460 [Candidatus Pacearchaeota archaeon]|nr:hypothetical protein [Candidatus Pacearchaeota archaeon]